MISTSGFLGGVLSLGWCVDAKIGTQSYCWSMGFSGVGIRDPEADDRGGRANFRTISG